MAESEKPKKPSCSYCGHVGIFRLANKLTSLQYPKIKRKIQQATSQQPRLDKGEKWTQTSYNLGNGNLTNDSEKATVMFFKREPEFLQILEYRKKAHKVVFIPETYLYGPVAHKAVTRREGRSILDEEKQKELTKYDGDLKGKEVEENFYKETRTVFEKLQLTNTVVISGWEVKGGKNVTSREFDFHIVCEPLKTIFQVEIKKTLVRKTSKQRGETTSRAEAFEQLDKGHDFFNSNIPFSAESGWSYVKIIHFKENLIDPDVPICDACTPYVFDANTDALKHWENLMKPNQTANPEKDDPTYLFALKYIIHQMFQQGDCVTPTDVLKACDDNISKMSTMEIIFFWSNIQFNLLTDAPETKKVAFLSAFGTGKTTLLKERAKKLLKKNEKVVFIIFRDDESNEGESFLFQSYVKEFKDFPSSLVQFHHLSNSGTSNDVWKIIKDNNSGSHFFFDEVLVTKGGLTCKDLVKMAKEELSEETFLWIACQSEKPPDKSMLEGFVIPEMLLPLRYCSNVLSTSEALKEIEGGTCFPPTNFSFNVILNQGTKCLFFSLQKDTSLACAVDQLTYVLDNERAKTLIKIDFDKDTIIEEFKKSSVQNRLIFSKNYISFLEESSDDGIMILSSKDNSLIRGFEFPILVHFSSGIEGEHVQDIYSRCKLKIIIVCNENHAKKVVKSNPDCTFASVITVYGKLMPESYEQSIKENDLEEVVSLLNHPRRPLPVEARNKASQTALMIACINKATDIVDTLLNKSADVDAVDANGWSPVHFAAAGGDLDILKKMIDAIINTRKDPELIKLSLHSRTNKGENAFHLAAKIGHLDVLKFLNQNQDFTKYDKSEDSGSTALHYSSKSGHLEVVKWLINTSSRKKINCQDEDGQTALHLASKEGHLSIVACLLRKRAKVNLKDKKGITPLHKASFRGHLDIVKYFITDCGVNVHFQDNDGWSALHYASLRGHLKVVKWLTKEARAEVNLKNKNGLIPLHLASVNGHLDIVKHFTTDCGVNVNCQDDYGRSVLYYASASGHSEVVKFLVDEAGADVNLQDKNGKTDCGVNVNFQDNDGWSALHFASQEGYLEIVKWLAKDGKAEVNLKDKNGYIPLHIASGNGHLDIVKHFITDCEVNVNFQDNDGVSALHLASQEGHLEVVKWLAKDGKAEVNLKDKNGSIPLHIASFNGHLDIVKHFITDCGVNVNSQNLASQEGHLEVVKWLTKEAGIEVYLEKKRRLKKMNFKIYLFHDV